LAEITVLSSSRLKLYNETSAKLILNASMKVYSEKHLRVALIDSDKNVHVILQNVFKQFGANVALDIYLDASQAI
jgi:hypothetical protein